MRDTTDWTGRIAELVRVKETLDRVDPERLWEFRLPRPGATEARLQAVEAHLGEPLDPQYRSFLAHADGWPAFHHSVDLFGTEDLLGGPRLEKARTLLGYIEEEPVAGEDLQTVDLLPIGVSSNEINLFTINRQSAAQPGQVILYKGYEVERYPAFEAFFVAIIEYTRRDVEYLGKRR